MFLNARVKYKYKYVIGSFTRNKTYKTIHRINNNNKTLRNNRKDQKY